MKKSTRRSVNKALTPEEKAILGNIRSLLEQLDSEAISEDMNAPATDEVMNSADEEDLTEDLEKEFVEEEDEEDILVNKSATPDEVANNNAEERLCAEDTDIENALAVLKAVMSNKRKVRKSVDYVRLERKVDALTSAVESMIEGFGLVDTPAPVRKSSQVLVRKSARQREEDLSDVLTSLFK